MREIYTQIYNEFAQIKLDYLRAIGVDITELIEHTIINYEVKSEEVA